MNVSRKLVAPFVLFAALTCISGCPTSSDEGASLSLIALDDSSAYLQYYPSYSGWETLPSSVWQVDLATGQTHQLLDNQVRYDVQIAAGFAVSERPTASGSEIVAQPLSGGEAHVLLTRSIELGGRYDRSVIATATRAIARTDSGIAVFDLSNSDARSDFPLSVPVTALLAAGETFVLMETERTPQGVPLILDLESGEATTIPDDANYAPYLFDSVFIGRQLFTVGFQRDGDHNASALLAFDIPSRTWAKIADVGSSDFLGVTVVAGRTIDSVVVARFGVLSPSGIELISPDGVSGTIVTSKFASESFSISTNGSMIAWLNPDNSILTVKNLSSGEQREFNVFIPQ